MDEEEADMVFRARELFNDAKADDYGTKFRARKPKKDLVDEKMEDQLEE